MSNNLIFYVYFTNHEYFSQESFGSEEAARDYGVSKGFDFAIYEYLIGQNPYKDFGQVVGTWTYFGGYTKVFRR